MIVGARLAHSAEAFKGEGHTDTEAEAEQMDWNITLSSRSCLSKNEECMDRVCKKKLRKC